ncbi:hypothetical protein O181_007025 [Austropuccinia psidii MF-1]|uniref:Uncharacterized protein n=1 Tax=Austropuccinia psidii MF-1 TaxID=1389203 RepID=A0A9Q3BM46_9BASI|nr:hypothetical protein [Austropuccinia psidii MF-1]
MTYRLYPSIPFSSYLYWLCEPRGKRPTGCIPAFCLLLFTIVIMFSNNLISRLLLTSDNYFTWVTMLESELDIIGALDLILGTDQQSREIQENLNCKAYNLIIQCLNEENISFVPSILSEDNKRNGQFFWNMLKEKYMSNGISSQALAYTKFSQVKFTTTLDFIQEIRTMVSKMLLVGFKLEESALSIMVLSKLP